VASGPTLFAYVTLGKMGTTDKQYYIPWAQATVPHNPNVVSSLPPNRSGALRRAFTPCIMTF
jgi:hypothetical protein